MSQSDYLELIANVRERLERVRVLESEADALRNANEALHRKLDALENRPAVKVALAAASALDRMPQLKVLMKAVLRK
jgi:hypothetical protein